MAFIVGNDWVRKILAQFVYSNMQLISVWDLSIRQMASGIFLKFINLLVSKLIVLILRLCIKIAFGFYHTYVPTQINIHHHYPNMPNKSTSIYLHSFTASTVLMQQQLIRTLHHLSQSDTPQEEKDVFFNFCGLYVKRIYNCKSLNLIQCIR